MGLLSGGLNGRRYRITTPLPQGFRDLYLEQVRENTLSDEDANDGEPRIGWINPFDVASAQIELNDLLVDHYIALTMRTDTKKIQGAYKKIAMARRVAEVCAERGVEKLSKAERGLVEEAYETALFGRALPTVATTDLCWDIDTGEVVVFATSENTLELVRSLVKETFGVTIHPERLVDWLADKLSWQEIIDLVDSELPGGRASRVSGEPINGHREDDPLEGHEFMLGSDFITWLWLQSEASDGLFRVIDHQDLQVASDDGELDDEWNDVTESLRQADLTLWIDSRLKLQELTEEDPATTILIGLSPSTTTEARQNLHQGKRPVEAKLGLKVNDLECLMTLQAAPHGLGVTGLKIPTVVKSGREEKLLERAVLLDLVHTTIKKLFQQFFLARTSPAWEERVQRWLAEEV